MGPHAFACGNRTLTQTEKDIARLQWGRTLLRAETSVDYWCWRDGGRLQWGRTLLRAETISAWLYPGAQSLLQWGRTLLRAETPFASRDEGPLIGFNGAARFCVRKRLKDIENVPAGNRFNG